MQNMLKKLAAALLLSLVTYGYLNKTSSSSSEPRESPTSGVTMECLGKYCPPNYQIQVDRWDSTQGTDQSLGAGVQMGPRAPNLADIYDAAQRRAVHLAENSPGVKLVAHALA